MATQQEGINEDVACETNDISVNSLLCTFGIMATQQDWTRR